MSVLKGKRAVLGVTGSIACYKAVEIASKLTQLGVEVDVILTQAAAQFVTPLTFQSVTGRRAYQDADLWGDEGHVLHIGIAKAADLLLVAPATANTLAKLANGIADNLLSLTAVANTAPLLVAPALDGGMYEHPATQENLTRLETHGAHIVGPASGHLASGLKGVGRMEEPTVLIDWARYWLGRGGPLRGRKVVVSAGGTQEAIDPVRVIANRSSGKQGYAIAQTALDLGADVTLVSGPTALAAPIGAEVIQVTSAEEMLAAVQAAARGADALIMAAAVADFKPAQTSQEKLKRAQGAPTIELGENPDILQAVSAMKDKPAVMVGFAAESQDLTENAAKKLKDKDLDLLVANDISSKDAGFEVDTNRVVILARGGSQDQLPLMSKAEVAEALLERVVALLA
jgi:phosphopantothenoylcysteine decarboxylase/phosphopantothenate--cysteine ligase